MPMELQQTQRMTQTLSPQLKQAFDLLQLPLLDLRAFIQKEMEQNPTIEQVDSPIETSLEAAEPVQHEDISSEGDLDFDPKVDAVLRQDDNWRDYFLQGMENADPEDEAKYQHAYDSITQPVTLQEHLLEQLTLTELPPKDRQAAELIIGDIDERGYFTGSFPDLSMVTGESVGNLEQILKVIQTFTPPGVGARNLRECLLLQVSPAHKPDLYRIIDNHLDDFASCTPETLAQKLKVTIPQLQVIQSQLKELNPTPGYSFAPPRQAEYVTPELAIRPKGDKFEVILNNSDLPVIHISERYRQMLADPKLTAKDKSYIRERIRAGLALIQNIERRQQTIRNIANAIANAQASYFKGGELKPLTMQDIADQVGVHETTVSRTVNGKYASTPRGLMELRKFFPRGFAATQNGTIIVTDKVRDALKELVDKEPPSAPLSDQTLVKLLKDKGYTIARRTVAKYRDQLGIPASKDRKKI